MKTIRATGGEPAMAATLHISGGHGNIDDVEEIHIMMRDTGAETDRVLLGWFPVDALLRAIEDSRRRPVRLTEPAKDAA